MDKVLKTYPIYINDEGEMGVDAIALVDQPAIKRNWMAFNAVQDFKFEIVDDKKRIVSGYFMLADTEIYRRTDEMGEFNVTFPRVTVEKIVDKYFMDGNVGSFNLNHDPNQKAIDVFLIESLIIDSDRGVLAPEKFGAAPDGSWWGSVRVMNDKIWQDVLDGTFQGFSVEGGFLVSKEPVQEEFSESDVFDASMLILSTIWVTEYMQDGEPKMGEVYAETLEEANTLAAQENELEGVTDTKVVGNLLDALSDVIEGM